MGLKLLDWKSNAWMAKLRGDVLCSVDLIFATLVSLAKASLKISLPAYLNSSHLETKQNMIQQKLKQRVSFKRKSNPFELRHIKLPYAYIFCRTRNLPCFLFSRAFPVWVLPHHKYFFTSVPIEKGRHFKQSSGDLYPQTEVWDKNENCHCLAPV